MTVMSKEEVLRRLRALIEIPIPDRPISIYRFAWLSGIHKNSLYGIARGYPLGLKSIARLSKAFEIVENDQLVVKKRVFISGSSPGGSLKADVEVSSEKRPPCIMVRRVHFTKNGIKTELIPTNPLAFTKLTPYNK